MSVTDKLTMQNKLDEAGSVTIFRRGRAKRGKRPNYVDIVKATMLRRIIQAGNE